MGDPKKKIGLLCLLLIVSSGWIALTSHREKAGGRRLEAEGAYRLRPAASSLAWSDSNLPATPPTEDRRQTKEDGAVLGPRSSVLGDPSALGSPELFLRMMLSVGLVIGLGAVALYLSKRALPRVAKAASKEIHVLETTHLGPRKALHLVEVGGRRLLIASTSDSVTMLAGVPERAASCLESSPMDDAWPDASRREELPPAEKSRWGPEPNSERR